MLYTPSKALVSDGQDEIHNTRKYGYIVELVRYVVGCIIRYVYRTYFIMYNHYTIYYCLQYLVRV